MRPREKAAFDYHGRLRDTYQYHPEVRRILQHRHVPRRIYTANKELQTIQKSQLRKKFNRINITKTGEKDKSDRVQPILKVGFEEKEENDEEMEEDEP